MKQITVKSLKNISVAFCAFGILAGALVLPLQAEAAETKAPDTITLPVPDTKDGLTVLEALNRRKSTRGFSGAALSDRQLSAVLWAANGINRTDSGKRVNPTTKGVYNIDVYAVTADGIINTARRPTILRWWQRRIFVRRSTPSRPLSIRRR